jgi:hypothetical protein
VDADLLTLLRSSGLGAVADAIAPTARLSVRLVPARIRGGVSCLGGQPHLPDGVAWPRRAEGTLAHIATVALNELPAAPEWFPDSGRLSFFYDIDNEPWGDEPEDADGAVVVFDALALSDLPVTAPPPDLPPDNVLPERGLAFRGELTLPDPEASAIASLDLTLEQLDRYDEVRDSLAGASESESGPRHRLFGHPDVIQAPLAEPDGDEELLLQLAPDDDLAFDLGDDASLYFLVPATGDVVPRLTCARAVVQSG